METKFEQKFTPTPKPKLNKLAITILIFVVLILISAIATSIYFYKKANKVIKTTQLDEKEELVKIIGLVGRHIVLPDDEEPTLATVNDPSQLSNEPFFAKAKKGFKVLVYANAQKAILYDPETDRLVEVSSIRVTNGEENTQGLDGGGDAIDLN